jgi:hypothetical protein
MVATARTASVTHVGREVERASFIHSSENDACIGVPASHRLKKMSGIPVTRVIMVGMTHNSLVFGFITGF